jgi:hypothetical protein
MSWLGVGQDGTAETNKTEDLVLASSYTEAEKVAYALIENQNRSRISDEINFEIIKTKISDLIYNDTLTKDDNLLCGLVYSYFEEEQNSGVGLYACKLALLTIDEKTAKEKWSSTTVYTPAKSNTDAARIITDDMNKRMVDFIIRDIKFDKAESIILPPSTYQHMTESY